MLSAALLALLVSLWACAALPPDNAPLPTLSPQRHQAPLTHNLQRNRPSQALYHLELLAREGGWTPALHRQAAAAWRQLGQPDRAFFHWQQILTSAPDALTLREVAVYHLDRAQWSQAADTLERLLEQEPNNAWASAQLGMLLAPLDPARAEPLLQRAMNDPVYLPVARALRVVLLENRAQDALDSLTIPLLVGLALVEQEQWHFAEAAFSHANALYLASNGSPLPEALAYMSLAQNRQGKDGSAAILQAVQLSPNDAQIRFLQALHYRHVGALEQSLNALIQAVALSPESPALYAELGTAYRLLGDYPQAERWLQAAVTFSGEAEPYPTLLQEFYAAEAVNLGDSGFEALQALLRTNPNNADALASTGWMYYIYGDEPLARETLAQALALAPRHPTASYYLARILIDSDEAADAVPLLEAVVAGEGAYAPEAARMLEVLSSS